MSIVDLGTAVRHLKADIDVDSRTVEECLARVEGLVLEHLEREAYDEDEAVPFGVQQAVLVALTEAYDNRENDPLTPPVIALLRPHRSPGVF